MASLSAPITDPRSAPGHFRRLPRTAAGVQGGENSGRVPLDGYSFVRNLKAMRLSTILTFAALTLPGLAALAAGRERVGLVLLRAAARVETASRRGTWG